MESLDTFAFSALAHANEVVVVDWTVTDYPTLIAGLDPNIPVIVLQPGSSGLQGLTKALAGFANLDAIHLVTHGWGGALQLGGQLVTNETLAAQADDVQAIAHALKAGGDLMLYGCSVANGDAGQDFVNDLAALLGDVDVAASTDKTGPTKLGGDWELEWRSGEIETVLPFTLQGMQDIGHCLGCVVQGTTLYDGQGPYPGIFNTSSSTYVGAKLNSSMYISLDGLNAASTIAGFNTNFPSLCGSSNIAPTFIGSTTLSVDENASAADIKSLLRASDSDSGQTLTWSQHVATNHGGTLTISSATASSGSTDITPGGTLTYAPAANYVGTETFTIKVADSATTPGSATREITITVNDINPSITGSQVFSVDENSTPGTAVGTVAKTGDTNGLNWSITGGTGQSLFDINTSTGAITVKSGAVLDYETTNSYTLMVAVDDEDVDSTADSTQSVTVNLNDVAENAAPTVNQLDGDSSSFVTGSSEYIDSETTSSAVAVLDSDSANFDTGYLLISRTSGTADGSFSSDPGTNKALKFGADGTITAGETVYVDTAANENYIDIGTVDATHNGQNGANLKIAFNASSSPAVAEAILKYLKFTAPTFGARAYSVVINDGDGGTSTASNFTMTATVDATSTVTASAVVTEPVALDTTKNTVGQAINVFDFTITDVGTTDGLPTALTQIALSTSGTGDFSKVNWLLSGGSIAGTASGTYNSGTNTITFASLTESIANNTSQTYTVSAYYNNTSGLTDGQTYILSVDGDSATNFTVSATGSQMASQSPITNSTGTTVRVAPTVTSITSSKANGSYKAGEIISIQVVFSESVTVTNTPQLTLETGTIDRVLDYVNGSPGTTLNFTYTVQTGDTSSDLDYTNTTALALNTGTINATSDSLAATLTLPAPGAANSLGANKAIVIDTTAPGAPTNAIDLQSGSDSGPSSSDNVTKTTNPTVRVSLTGTNAAVGDTLELLLGGASLGTAKTKVLDSTDVTTNGYVDFTIANGDLGSDGSKTLTAKVTDVASNVGTAGGSLTITLDTTNPAINIDNGTAFAYTENAAAAALNATATVTEAHTPGASVLTVQISTNAEAADTLSLPSSASTGINISGTDLRTATTNIGIVTTSSVTNGTTWTLTFLSSATQQNIQETIAAIRYHNTSENPGTSNRTVTFTLTDGAGNAATPATRTVAVTAENDAPTAIAPTTGSVSTYDSANFTAATLGATDVDHSSWTFSIQSVTHSIAGAVTNTSGDVFDLGTGGSSSSSAGVATAALRAVSPVSLTAGTYTVNVRADDVAGGTFDQAVTVTVSDTLVVTVAAIDSSVPAGSYFTDSNDGGGLDLREALALAAGGNKTIGFAAGLNGSTITLGGTYTVAAGTVFDADTVGTLTISGQTLSLQGAFGVTNGTGDTLTINSHLADNGTDNSALTRTGAGTLVLGGTNNTTSTGLNSITVSGGTLQVAGDTNLSFGGTSDPVSVTLENGSTLKGTGTGEHFINNKIHLGSGGGTIAYANTGGSDNLRFSGAISGGDLTKTGVGLVSLDGTNSYGATTVLAGTLGVSYDANLGTGTVTLDGGTLRGYGDGPTIDNAVTVGSNGGTIMLDADYTFSGLFSGSGTLTTSGISKMTLTNTGNTHTGDVNITAGTLVVQGGGAIGDTSAVTISGSGKFQVSGNETIGALTGNGTQATDITIDSGRTLTATYSSGTSTLAGVIGGSGNFTTTGAGTLELTGNNTYTGATTVSQGTLTANRSSGAIANTSAVTVSSGATLTLSYDETIGSLSGAGNVTLGSNTLTAGGDNTSTTFSGVLSGSGGLTKTGTGTLELTGNNTYTGATTVSAGTLTLNKSGGAIANASAVTVDSGATLALSASDTIGPLAGAGTVSLASGTTLTVQEITGIDTTFSGNITGATGILAISGGGTGTLTLSGTNTYGGLTRLASGGILKVSGGSAISDTSQVTVNNGTLTLLANEQIGSLTSANNPATSANVNLGSFTLTMGDATDTTFPGVISGTGNLIKTGTGTLTLAGVNTYTGTTTVSQGTLSIAPDGGSTAAVLNGSGATPVTVSANATLAGSGTINSAVTIATNATLSPGIAGTNSGVGKLSITGNLIVNGTLVADIKGTTTAGSDYDQVAVVGSVTLNSG